MKAFFDPDTNWKSLATLQHFLFLGVALMLCLSFFFSPLTAWLLTMMVGVLWEVAQWDTCRWIPSCHEGGRLDAPFLAGYGFSLLDISAEAVGSAIVAALLILW